MRIGASPLAVVVCLLAVGGVAEPPGTIAPQDDRRPETSAGPDTASKQAEIRRRLSRLVDDLHGRGLFDGAVVVGDGREVVWAQGVGYANVERKVPFTEETAADGASLAKTFTAAVVLALADERLLDLDDPVRRWLPELPYPTISWRHLLSHSSGLPVLDYDYFDRFLPAGQIRTTETLLAVLATHHPALAFTPGSAFEYSSFGFDLAALAAARVTRSAYASLLEARIFGPLGIRSAFVRPARLVDFPGIRTLGYRRVGGTLVTHDVFDLEGFHGGSNVCISAHDLHRWNASFLEAPVLSAAAAAAALQPARIGDAPSGLTLGSWYRAPDASAYWYSGHLQGFHSEVFRDVRTRSSIVYVSNNTIEPWVQKGLVRAIRAVLDGKQVPAPAPPATDAIVPQAYSDLTGRWVSAAGKDMAVELTGNRLTVERDGVHYRMVQTNPRAFYVPGLDLFIGIARGRTGEATRLHVSSNVDEEWVRRMPTPDAAGRGLQSPPVALSSRRTIHR